MIFRLTKFAIRRFLRTPGLCILPVALFAMAPATDLQAAKRVDPGWTQEGIASYYYGPLFHGKLTANQEIYDQNSLTAAHKTLPINTLVEVTRKLNGRKIIVRINNRGPYVKGRIIDLSKEAARRLDMIDDGIAKVVIRVLPPNAVIELNAEFSTADAEVVTRWFHYAIILETYATREEAEQLLAELQNNGVEETNLDSDMAGDGQRIYKVVIGGFENRSQAGDYLARLNDASLIFNWQE